MSNKGASIVLSVDSAAKQEEITKAARMMLKDVKNTAGIEKENHSLGHKMAKDLLLPSSKGPTEAKRMRSVSSKATQTTFFEEAKLMETSVGVDILRTLDEKRRVALETTLAENQKLTEELAAAQEELQIMRNVISEYEDLVGVMKDMLSDCTCSTQTSIDKNSSSKVDDSGFAPCPDSDSDE
ncbi:uncharacterized protein LOC131206293 [Anopheles bellator]|uniref:uncharacterized protein LOC131206293 n=1 Tax=Anopheles bellator TaxID=139047 RepID=UPI00264955D1|nr:uncharacterized protein LOC131206293 [Anopheles bellator]